MKTRTVAVVGAAGHVGLGMTLCIAKAGHKVYGIDIDQRAVETISSGTVPFVEEGAEGVLAQVLKTGRLTMTTDLSVVRKCEVVVIILGTPIDENLNPIIVPLVHLCGTLKPHLRRGQLLILRSTVSPGTTDNMRGLLEETTGLRVGKGIHLVFAPERVVQGKSLEEIPRLPQLIGAYDEKGFRRAEEFFRTFVQNDCLRLTPLEAELGKLMCNMARYVTFALANEFSLIAEEYNTNIHRIFDACSHDYQRFSLPTPGPNVSGPCLFKDGFFLVERFPYPELILTAFKINESMPVQIFKKIRAKKGISTVAILGLAFKAGNDDTRYSLSFKLKKLLEGAGYQVVAVDPFLPDFQDTSVLWGSDCVVLMTPHAEFADLDRLIDCVQNESCWYVDLWGFWRKMRGRSDSGWFQGRELTERKDKEPKAVVRDLNDKGSEKVLERISK